MFSYIKTNYGPMEIYTLNGMVYLCHFVDEIPIGSEYLDISTKDLHSYFRDKYELVGTPFQKEVWRAIGGIPRGQTRTYGEIAEAIGSSKSARAVAKACGSNRLAILVPCHRVVAKNGMGGYKWGADLKAKLLRMEEMDLQ